MRFLIEALIEEADSPRLRAYSCGRLLTKAGVPHQTALEESMACGFGVCIGCALPVHGGDQEVLYERCCVEGPVFDFERPASMMTMLEPPGSGMDRSP